MRKCASIQGILIRVVGRNVISMLNHDKNEISPIIIKTPKRNQISEDDRKAYEDYFGKSEGSGY